jgi:hypothetical protein
MVDTLTYRRLHPDVPSDNSTRRIDDLNAEPETSGNLPDEGYLLLLPPTIHGYDMYQHEWTELLVSKIADVVWNERAFKQLALPRDSIAMLKTMTRIQTRHDPEPYRNNSRHNEQILLLHGGPGTGKTFAAEAIAEVTRRPVYQISCSRIISEPQKAELSLKAISVLCNTWNCVAVMEDADIFFEQRATGQMEHNAMVLTLIRSLELFQSTLILTTNRMDTFDKSLFSRCHLIVHFEPLTEESRGVVWRNLIDGLGEPFTGISFQIENDYIRELAAENLDNWEITNIIRTAAQLARVESEHSDKYHFMTATKCNLQFVKYVDMLRGHALARRSTLMYTCAISSHSFELLIV